jgi:transposase
MRAAYVGLDLAKNVFQVHAADRSGCAIHNRKLSRSQVAKYFSSMPAVTVGMEASASAHHWARELQKFGHRVRLMAPIFVQPCHPWTDMLEIQASFVHLARRMWRLTGCLIRADLDVSPSGSISRL